MRLERGVQEIAGSSPALAPTNGCCQEISRLLPKRNRPAHRQAPRPDRSAVVAAPDHPRAGLTIAADYLSDVMGPDYHGANVRVRGASPMGPSPSQIVLGAGIDHDLLTHLPAAPFVRAMVLDRSEDHED